MQTVEDFVTCCLQKKSLSTIGREIFFVARADLLNVALSSKVFVHSLSNGLGIFDGKHNIFRARNYVATGKDALAGCAPFVINDYQAALRYLQIMRRADNLIFWSLAYRNNRAVGGH